MITRMLYTSFWCDEYVRFLSDLEARLFLFFITNEKVNLSGIYRCPDFYTLSLFPNLIQDKLSKVKEKLSTDRKVLFSEDWVYLVNASKYNSFDGPKTIKPLLRELSLIPLRVFSYFNDTVSIPYRYPIDTTIINYNHNHNQSSEKTEIKLVEISPDKKQENMEKLREILQEKGIVHDNG